MLGRFFLVPRNGQALLGMPDIETLDVLTIKCNTIGIQTQNKHTYCEMEDRCQYTNNTLETGEPNKFIT